MAPGIAAQRQHLRRQAAGLREQVEAQGLRLPGSPACSRPTVWGEVTVGGPVPLVATATTAADPAQAAEQASRAARSGADVVELRLDLLDAPAGAAALAAFYLETTAQVASALHAAGCPVPVLLTVRTAAEGGALQIRDADYAELLAALLDGLAEQGEAAHTRSDPAAHRAPGRDPQDPWAPRDRRGSRAAEGGSRLVAAVDMELARGCLPALAERAHRSGTDVVASAHFFGSTPPRTDLRELLSRMQAAGADVAKVAVMPRQDADVVTLLAATAQARADLEVPLVTMSMGERGVVTRLAGAAFGSALSFATAGGQASAPGQPPIGVVREAWAGLGVR